MSYHGVRELAGIVVPEPDVPVLMGRYGEWESRVGDNPRYWADLQSRVGRTRRILLK